MKNNVSVKIGYIIGITILFIISSVPPIVFGYNIRTTNKETLVEDYNFNRYNISEIFNFIKSHSYKESLNSNVIKSKEADASKKEMLLLDGPMNSPWPMYCHDVRHTGRSPYRAADNPGTEKWRFDAGSVVWGSPVIDNDGIIYIGAIDLFAIYPNGTMKWKHEERFRIYSAPAVDENGVLYVGSIWKISNYLYAIYTSNGTLKWKYYTGDSISSSPAIDDDSIYFGSQDGYIYALYSNGTLKWKYLTDDFISSSTAISEDGTIYCGSDDGNLYALYPNNGTLKWKYQTGDWVGRGPSIADDGTIYFGSWDGFLYAVYPDGTLKWKTGGHLAGTTPVTAQDGTIYVGNRYLSAIYPSNGSVKWTFDPGSDRTIRGGNPCISADGIIFFGTHIGETAGGELIAVNPDGTERWRIMLATDWIWSAPAIGSDGTVYVGSTNDASGSEGYLHAVGPPDPNAPSAPQINGQTSIKPWRSYEYTFNSTSPLGRDVYYYIDWGDNTVKDWFGPFGSSEEVKASHTWFKRGTYIINARAKDSDDLLGAWGELKVTTSKSKVINFNSLLLKLIEKFPVLEKLLIFMNFIH